MPAPRRPLFEIKLPWWKARVDLRRDGLFQVETSRRGRQESGRFESWSQNDTALISISLSTCIVEASSLCIAETETRIPLSSEYSSAFVKLFEARV